MILIYVWLITFFIKLLFGFFKNKVYWLVFFFFIQKRAKKAYGQPDGKQTTAAPASCNTSGVDD